MHAHFKLNNKTFFKIKHELIDQSILSSEVFKRYPVNSVMCANTKIIGNTLQ